MNKFLALVLILALSFSASDAGKPKAAKLGSEVSVRYIGKVDEGIIFDTNINQEPLKFVIGDNSVLKGFEDGIIDMKVGDKKTINIPADYAYGGVYPSKIIQVALAQVQTDLQLREGANLKLQGPSGEPIAVRVVEITDKDIYLDANHLLAGKDLTFEVSLLSADKAKKKKA